MKVIAVDPGTYESAFVVYDAHPKHPICDKGIRPNETFLYEDLPLINAGHMAIEIISSQGMAVGQTTFETCVWIGRFIEGWRSDFSKVYRKDVKLHLCGSSRAKDANVRMALLDRFGPGKEKAIGGIKCKKCKGKGWFGRGRAICPKCDGRKWAWPPGPLHGISTHEWAALAVAVTWMDLNGSPDE